MQTCFTLRRLALPLWWQTIDVDGPILPQDLHRLEKLLREDKSKCHAVKYAWLNPVSRNYRWTDHPEATLQFATTCEAYQQALDNILSQCPELYSLRLDCFWPDDTGQLYRIIREQRHLQMLSLTGIGTYGLDPCWVASTIAHKQNSLTHLELVNVAPSVENDNRPGMASLNVHSAGFLNLASLRLTACRALNNSPMNHYHTPTLLTELVLDDCPSVIPEHLEDLLQRMSPTLQTLRLNATVGYYATDSFASPLWCRPDGCLAPSYDMPRLEQLLLGDLDCSPFWIARFRFCPRLNFLAFRYLRACGIPERLSRDKPDAFVNMLFVPHHWVALRYLHWSTEEDDDSLMNQLRLLCGLRKWKLFHEAEISFERRFLWEDRVRFRWSQC